MSQLSQRDAVIKAVESLGVEVGTGNKIVLDKEELSQVVEICTQSYLSGDTRMKDTPANAAKLADPAKIRSYARSQVNDAFRKDKRLNGDVNYHDLPKVLERKGSRASAGDEQLKELKKLKSAYIAAGETSKVALVDEAIAKRAEVVQKEKAKDVKVDLNKIDPELLEKLGMEAS